MWSKIGGLLMKMFDFMQLAQSEQTDLLYRTGVFLGKIKSGKQIKILYQVDAFYVEITYKKYRLIISAIRSFCSTDELDPYLRQINIEELINH